MCIKKFSIFIIFILFPDFIDAQIKLITLDPGHFHAALIQKAMYNEIDPAVHIYAPQGDDLRLHLERINAYNNREINPTNWKQQVYTGDDFLEKMVADKAGNVVVISGNNKKKNRYILKSIQAGFNVLADKPMVIDNKDFEMLLDAFTSAEKNNLLLYDIMTERFEITNILQKEFSLLPEIFGTLQKGSPENPAVIKESVHHFYKYVSGTILQRPAWFFDVNQEGEGIVDVMTHLVDLVQWECFPEQVIDYKKDIQINSAKHWSTELSKEEFKIVTNNDSFPEYLSDKIVNNKLLVYSNGEINYRLKDVHVKTVVEWKYKAEQGSGDAHYSIMRGTKANLIIKQSEEENFKPVLFIEPLENSSDFEKTIRKNIDFITKKYPGVEVKKKDSLFEVVIPEKYKEGHEAHFASVTKCFLEYLTNKNIPSWEIPNMIAKYYTTTEALEIANQ